VIAHICSVDSEMTALARCQSGSSEDRGVVVAKDWDRKSHGDAEIVEENERLINRAHDAAERDELRVSSSRSSHRLLLGARYDSRTTQQDEVAGVAVAIFGVAKIGTESPIRTCLP